MTQVPARSSERAIVWVLRYGSLASAALMALGLVLAFARQPAHPLAAFEPIRPIAVLPLLVQFDPAAITEFGLLLLLLTPVLRIVAALVGFALERDVKYVLISLGVLLTIVLSITFAMQA